ncbi:MAG: hypothetical protein IV108_12725 [Burkholderiales bacterium]|nr:hypothetical protein [Burkholderiales bacterium]
MSIAISFAGLAAKLLKARLTATEIACFLFERRALNLAACVAFLQNL